MQAVSVPAQARSRYRHQLRTLTYVTLDEANGGIVRNLSSKGLAVQAVAPLRLEQRIRLRFELRFPRLRVEAHGQVSWTNSSGQCGIQFVDLPARTSHHIDEWIFANLLEAVAREAKQPSSIFGAAASIVRGAEPTLEDNGLTLSSSARPSIPLEPSFKREAPDSLPQREDHLESPVAGVQLNWLARPISLRALIWLLDSLIMFAALLLFALVFLSIAHELPPWPLTLGTASAAAAFVAATYWILFAVLGGPTLGTRLAQAASEEKEEDEAVRIR